MSGTHNILVISDLHLGEDLAPNVNPQTTRDLRRAERHLIEFLDKYTRHRADGRPWRLVINGDMVDFMGICVFPDQMPGQVACTADEREHGLGRRKDAACAKVAVVIEHHHEFFAALARFIAAGNAVAIVCGNHDAELYWPEVQDALRQGLARCWRDTPAAARTGAATASQVAAGIDFHPWFYYEPGVAWIEHGHQYDECCSFEYNLSPANRAGDALISNVDTAGMRYITNHIPEITPHGSEEWSFSGYLRLTLGMGLAGAWRLARGYGRFAGKLVSEWRAARVKRVRRERRARHLAALGALSRQTPLSEATLRALDSMHRPPVFTNLRRLMQVLMIDKVLVRLATLLVVVLSLMALPLLWGVALAATAVAVAHWIDFRVSRGRSVDATLPLQVVPARILEQVNARFVVFGHTHLPVAQRVAAPASGEPTEHPEHAERWYYNTGTWMPVGKQGLLRSFTHVVIRQTPRGATAALCQWRDGASRPFEPDWVPVRQAQGKPGKQPRQPRQPRPSLAPVVASVKATAQVARATAQATVKATAQVAKATAPATAKESA